MRITIARLRVWIVGVAFLLLAVLTGFFFYARYKAHRLITDLPGKLGATIARSSDGFTYSQSVKGRTAFTIHASKVVQFTGGASATLHDVVITLYGTQGDRSDRISGSEFNYDQKAGIVSAQGEVQIDLQAAPPAAGTPPTPAPGAIHVRTRGLVFNQKTQIATTPQYVEFSTPKGAGHSTGAAYDVQKGLLVLDSGVELTSSRDGKPVTVHADHAEFLRNSLQAFLLNPVTVYQADRTSSDQAIVSFRKDGSADHIDARGRVHLKSESGGEMTAGSAKIQLDERSRPTRADAAGGLNFVSLGGPRQVHGNAVEGTLLFDGDGVLHHAQARNAVSFVEQQAGLADDPAGSATREVRASQLDIDFLPDASGHASADKVLAAGGATAVLHTIHSKGPSQNTTIKGDQLLATLLGGHAIQSLRGTGHTSVLDVSPTGATSLTSADALLVDFATPAKAAAAPSGGMEAARIVSVVQDGNVVITQTPAQASGDSSRPATRATAARAKYTAASQLLHLTGSPRITSAGKAAETATDLAADTIDYHRDTALATAAGNVKATYPQPKAGQTPGAPGIGGQGPTHIIAANATLDQQHGLAVFRGRARLWQGANSVSAPVLELARNPEGLKAHGEPGGADSVLTVMAAASGPQHQPGVFRVQSRQLLYSDAGRNAVFTGAVTAEDPGGVIHCDQAEVFLAAAPNAPGTAPDTGRIDKVVATGRVALQQPGRRATGEKLIYSAAEGKFILTGTSATPPRLYDQMHGTVSGEALIFNTQDNSVSVTGGQSKAVTDTRTVR